MPLAVDRSREPLQHRRVDRHVLEEPVKRAQSVAAEEVRLVDHLLLQGDPVVGRCEPVVEDEGHPLHELLVGAHHAIEPPEVVVAPGVERGDRVLVVVDGSRPDEALALRVRQRSDGAVEPLPGELLGLTGARAETVAPEQPLGLNRPEAAPVDRNFA